MLQCGVCRHFGKCFYTVLAGNLALYLQFKMSGTAQKYSCDVLQQQCSPVKNDKYVHRAFGTSILIALNLV